MPIILKVLVSKIPLDGVRIQLSNPEYTTESLIRELTKHTDIDVNKITDLAIKVSPTKTISILSKPRLTLADLGVQNNAQIDVLISSTQENILPLSASVEERTAQAIRDDQKKNAEEIAQRGLITALTQAEKSQAHVIITVGSYLNHEHDESSLIRQQFPVDRLGDIAPEDAVHLIQIDPGFSNPPSHVLQCHEQVGWNLESEDNNNLVKTYRKDNYVITTIAASITDSEEQCAYFDGVGRSGHLLNVDLTKNILNATRNGTGFITGNFYAVESQPVISVIPTPQENRDLNFRVC